MAGRLVGGGGAVSVLRLLSLAIIGAAMFAAPAAAQVDTIATFGGPGDLGGLLTYRPRAAAFTSEGLVYFQGDGAYLLAETGSVRKVASQGQGPGDVNVVFSASAGSQGRVRFYDLNLARATDLDLASGEATTHSYLQLSLTGGYFAGHPIGNGRLISLKSSDLSRSLRPRPSSGSGEMGQVLDSIEISVRGSDGSLSVLSRHQWGARFSTRGQGGNFAPGHERTLVSVDGEWIAVASSHDPEILVQNATTGSRETRSAEIEPRPFNPDLHRRLVEEYLGSAGAFQVEGQAPAGVSEHRLQVVAAAGRPELSPLFDRVQMTQSGDVWLREVQIAEGDEDWWRVVGNGKPDRVVRLPRGFALIAIDGDRLAGYTRDDLDVATFFILRVR